MCSQDSVTGPYGHTFLFPDIMGSQDSVTRRIVYGNTISFSEIMGYLYSVTGQMATHFRFLISWAVNTPSPGHMATHSSSPISWSVKTPLLVVLCTATQSLFSEYMGSQCSVTGLYGHIFSYPVIMGSEDSVTGPYGHNSSSAISRAVKTPSLVVLFTATQSPFPRSWVVNSPSPGIWPHILLPRYHGQ
ncbi:hypothetical protein Bpfe_014440 [Biomphalaria pfeifferi]|uniref:Uncharacterized protein n=1 Tax=Biomphalaria pfeifferi TaxID=112525 RepID=A0AAD8BK25_BIOPF|nr:hypothetical protein Bpfe_014440 [Biomphalaria pfeifferi]